MESFEHFAEAAPGDQHLKWWGKTGVNRANPSEVGTGAPLDNADQTDVQIDAMSIAEQQAFVGKLIADTQWLWPHEVKGEHICSGCSKEPVELIHICRIYRIFRLDPKGISQGKGQQSPRDLWDSNLGADILITELDQGRQIESTLRKQTNWTTELRDKTIQSMEQTGFIKTMKPHLWPAGSRGRYYRDPILDPRPDETGRPIPRDDMIKDLSHISGEDRLQFKTIGGVSVGEPYRVRTSELKQYHEDIATK